MSYSELLLKSVKKVLPTTIGCIIVMILKFISTDGKAEKLAASKGVIELIKENGQ